MNRVRIMTIEKTEVDTVLKMWWVLGYSKVVRVPKSEVEKLKKIARVYGLLMFCNDVVDQCYLPLYDLVVQGTDMPEIYVKDKEVST